jgi:septum formation inhibitor-activating ATPase MinD
MTERYNLRGSIAAVATSGKGGVKKGKRTPGQARNMNHYPKRTRAIMMDMDIDEIGDTRSLVAP